MDVRMGLRKVMRAGGGRRQQVEEAKSGVEHKAKHSAKRADWNEGRKQDFSPRKKQFLELTN